MIPATLPDEVESRAERELFPVFRDRLDDSFMVFHSFKLLTRNLEDRFVEGEIDYLIYSPARGFLVLEVKGGAISYDGESGAWSQNRRPIRDPFVQARTSMHELLGFLRKHMKKVPPLPLAYAVCFPDVFTPLQTLPSSADPQICLTGGDLLHLQDRVLDILHAFTRQPVQPIDSLDNDRIRRAIMPYCEYGQTLVDRIGQTERRILALTENQCILLDFIHDFKQALIKGCAGSGKSIMAVKKARDLASEGNKVLLLAYNQMIGQRLAATLADVGPRVTVSTYHDFCMLQLRQHNCLPPMRKDDPAYWERDIPEAFFDLVKEHPIRYDAVIVDEGQDFLTEYWVTISSLVKPDGYFYIFYDPRQNLYGSEMQFPFHQPLLTLTRNCRNTRKVFDRLKPYGPAWMRLWENAPEGENVIEERSPYPNVRLHLLRSILHRLINEEGLSPSQIVVLGGHSMEHTCIGNNRNLGNFIISDATEEEPKTIHYHTHMKFKGCEAEVVILLDVDLRDERWSDTGLYTAISRARHALYIIWTG
ncbi:MAG: NERD domain-containing protein [Chloroflexota bacterium]